jgi:nicotinate-nucleotide pyrophosphorylase (carboxylating)
MDRFSRQIIKLAYVEDVGSGDITTEAIVPHRKHGEAVVIAKAEGVLSGSEAFKYAFHLASRKVTIKFHIRDGKKFKKNAKIASLKGPSRALLTGERVALNLLSHLSGVATFTARMVSLVRGTQVQVLDTRKTMPGLRGLEKQAVRHGDGKNHRLGLYDMVLIKDNHIVAAGGIDEALRKAKAHGRKVEIEVSNISQLKTALRHAPDIIMLDNFNLKMMSEAVKIIRTEKPNTKVEVSGGVNPKNIKAIASTGIDYISIGALTHSAPAADFSMRYLK